MHALLYVTDLAVPVTGLRARISHEWLENMLLPEDARTMLARLNAGKAGMFLRAFETYEREALDLAGRLHEFSSSTLVPLLPPLDDLDEAQRRRMCARLDEIYAAQVDVEGLGARYRQALALLSAALATFRVLLSKAQRPTAEAVQTAWAGVLHQALEFRAVVDDVPKGVVLP